MRNKWWWFTVVGRWMKGGREGGRDVPAPTTSTEADKRLRWPCTPKTGRRSCLE